MSRKFARAVKYTSLLTLIRRPLFQAVPNHVRGVIMVFSV